MSQANLEIVKRAIHAYNRRDFDSFSRLQSPDIVYRPIATFTEAQECKGRDEYRRFVEGFWEAWADDFAANLDTVRVYGDAVIARVIFTGHARASGVEVSGRAFIVYRFRDGLITQTEDFDDREDALRAAGVSV